MRRRNTDRLAVVELIGATTTKTGLKVESALDIRDDGEPWKISEINQVRLCFRFMKKFIMVPSDRRPASQWGKDNSPAVAPSRGSATTGRCRLGSLVAVASPKRLR